MTQSTAIVIFGCPADKAGDATPALTRRLVHALARFRHNTSMPWVILSGAAVRNRHAEADVMREWLLRRGVPSSRIHCDLRARNTAENAWYSALLLLTLDESSLGRAVLVTETYHAARSARLLTRSLGVLAAPSRQRWSVEIDAADDALAWWQRPLRNLGEILRLPRDHLRLGLLATRTARQRRDARSDSLSDSHADSHTVGDLDSE